jgi:hypothetical protein
MRAQSQKDMRERLEAPENQHYLRMFFDALRRMIEREKEKEQGRGKEVSDGSTHLHRGMETGAG